MLRSRNTLVLLSLLIGAASFAQPNPYGCHYFRNAPGPLHSGSLDRAQIDETIARSDTFDILHYDISLDLTSYAPSMFKAFTTVNFTPLMTDQGHIRFDLFQLLVDSVVGPDGPMTFSYDGQFLRVEFPTAPTVGEEYGITVHYHGPPHRDPDWGGFYFENFYMYNLGIGLSTIPPNFGKVWYPCFDSFVERATYTYHVKSAGSYRFHGQGNLIDEVQLGGDTVVRSFDLPQNIPTHLSAVAVAAYNDHDYVHSGANGDIPVRLTAKSTHLTNMIARFGDLGAAIDACEYWYGQYAYDRVGYILTTDGALEIPTNVAYPEFMTTEPATRNRDLYSHELGHHWWGNVVTPHIHNDMWLKEGPAEYTGHLVAEWLGGHDGLVEAVKDNMFYVLRQAHINDGGFQALSPMPDQYIYGTHTYYKGAAVLHNLRGYMGDEAFRQAMRGIQTDLANSTITAIQFKEALEAQSGQDLDAFFDAWVFAPGFSVFEVRQVDVQQGPVEFEVTLLIGQKLRGTSTFHEEVPIELTFVSEAGEVHEQQVIVGGGETTVQLDVPFEPAMVVLNRNTRLNQARMDREYVLYPGALFENLMPYTDFRIYATTLVDTTLFRVEHIWSAPDQGPLSADITEISTTHYWNVDGLWPSGTVLRGRMYYYGPNANELDFDLVGASEAGVAMLYRASPLDPWEVYPDQTINSGNLLNGSGFITLDNLRKGQYTFGKFSGSIGVAEGQDIGFSFSLSPVPASEMITVDGSFDGRTQLWCDIFSIDGRFMGRTITTADQKVRSMIDVSSLAPGSYLMRIQDAYGSMHAERRFEVVR